MRADQAHGRFAEEFDWNSPAGLREQARLHENDNHVPGDPGYCSASDADWTVETLRPSELSNAFGSAEDAAAWLDEEIRMEEAEGLHRGWRRLLVEQIEEEVVVLVRNGAGYIWDGWHRVAASVATGRPVRAIVGRPRGIQGQVS